MEDERALRAKGSDSEAECPGPRPEPPGPPALKRSVPSEPPVEQGLHAEVSRPEEE